MGDITIVFDKNITVFNLTLIDDKSINVTLIPNENQNNLTALSFTYECLEFSPQLIKLHIDFDNPIRISQNGVDKIQIEIIDNSVF